jgi:hypothetical protein
MRALRRRNVLAEKLAGQVPGFLDIPVPDEEDIGQVLPAGDFSIFAELGLDETELAAICSLESDDDPWEHVEDAIESIAARLGSGPAMERALDVALGSLTAWRSATRPRKRVRGQPLRGFKSHLHRLR